MVEQSENSKIVVTGMGAVSCLGDGVDTVWDGVCAGEIPFQKITRFELDESSYKYAGIVEASRFFDEAEGSLGARFAADAAQQAVSDVELPERKDMAVILSSNFGPVEIQEKLLSDRKASTEGQSGLAPGFFTLDVDHVARSIDAGGERTNISLSCASGNAALAHALSLLRRGETEIAVAGGYDSIQKVSWAGLACLRVMAVSEDDQPPVVRPFDLNRSGTLFSEGAGVMLLETEQHARERGATILAELAGAGVNNNAYHMTHADDEGKATAEVMTMALRDAGTNPDDVDCVNAHGTGTALNDKIETRSIKTVFGDRASSLPVTSIKGALGHGMGAASLLEAIVCVRSIQTDSIPPTANYTTPDPECDVNVVTEQGEGNPVRVIINNSAGIGGSNAAVVFRKLS